jgi:hypothetical protein
MPRLVIAHESRGLFEVYSFTCACRSARRERNSDFQSANSVLNTGSAMAFWKLIASSKEATTGQGRRLTRSYFRASLNVHQFSVTMFGQIRSCNSRRTYSKLVPAGEPSHLWHVVEYPRPNHERPPESFPAPGRHPRSRRVPCRARVWRSL